MLGFMRPSLDQQRVPKYIVCLQNPKQQLKTAVLGVASFGLIVGRGFMIA
jgi:hypothetical protein